MSTNKRKAKKEQKEAATPKEAAPEVNGADQLEAEVGGQQFTCNVTRAGTQIVGLWCTPKHQTAPRVAGVAHSSTGDSKAVKAVAGVDKAAANRAAPSKAAAPDEEDETDEVDDDEDIEEVDDTDEDDEDDEPGEEEEPESVTPRATSKGHSPAPR